MFEPGSQLGYCQQVSVQIESWRMCETALRTTGSCGAPVELLTGSNLRGCNMKTATSGGVSVPLHVGACCAGRESASPFQAAPSQENWEHAVQAADWCAGVAALNPSRSCQPALHEAQSPKLLSLGCRN